MLFLSLFCIYIKTFFIYLFTFRHGESSVQTQCLSTNGMWQLSMTPLSFHLCHDQNPFLELQFRTDWNTQIPVQVLAGYLVDTFVIETKHLLSQTLSGSLNLWMCRKQHRKESQNALLPDSLASPTFSSSCLPPPTVHSEHSASPPAPVLPPTHHPLWIADQSV